MRYIRALALILTAGAAVACGGGSNDAAVVPGGDGGSGALAASFTPDNPNPGPGTVALAAAPGSSGPTVTVRVDISGTDDVYGADLSLSYDPSMFEFTGSFPGTVLESGGQSVLYEVAEPQAGRLVVGASRTGGVSGVDVNGTQTLVQLTFRALEIGTSSLSFEPSLSSLQDSGPSQPGPIAGLNWSGGTLTGR